MKNHLRNEYVIQIPLLPHGIDERFKTVGFEVEGESLATRREQIIETDYQAERSVLRINIDRKENERIERMRNGAETLRLSLPKGRA